MADLSFDAIIVGGGCKGLSTGIYLAKYGGMSVGVFEETYELGGGLAGDQIAPGVQCNTHAGGHQWWYYDTVIKEDFPELWEEGLKLLPVGSNIAFGFDDNTCLVLYGSEVDPDGTRSAAQIARFSQKDAETFLKLKNIYAKYIQDALIEEAFSVATPVGVPGPLAKAFSHPEVLKASSQATSGSHSPLDVVKSFYESPEVQMMMLLQGSFLAVTGASNIASVIGIYGMFNYHFEDGGAHNLAHALHRVLYKYGAKTYTHSTVEKVIIENGVTKGIQLKDGSRIDAKKVVISTLSPHQLCHDLIGPDHLSSDILQKIDALETSGMCTSLITYAFAEPPKFKCASFNPDMYSKEMRSAVNFINLGPKSIEVALDQFKQMSQLKVPGGPIPRPAMININTDPENSHICRDPNICTWNLLDFMPPAWAQTPETWTKFQQEFPEWQLDHLKKYVDGASWDNVVGMLVRTPYWIAEHFKNMGPSGNVNIIDMIPSQMGSSRPIPELAQHRTPIKNLYATGSAFGNWGMSSFCGSYTCYKVLSEDYNLRMPWKEKGRSY